MSVHSTILDPSQWGRQFVREHLSALAQGPTERAIHDLQRGGAIHTGRAHTRQLLGRLHWSRILAGRSASYNKDIALRLSGLAHCSANSLAFVLDHTPDRGLHCMFGATEADLPALYGVLDAQFHGIERVSCGAPDPDVLRGAGAMAFVGTPAVLVEPGDTPDGTLIDRLMDGMRGSSAPWMWCVVAQGQSQEMLSQIVYQLAAHITRLRANARTGAIAQHDRVLELYANLLDTRLEHARRCLINGGWLTHVIGFAEGREIQRLSAVSATVFSSSGDAPETWRAIPGHELPANDVEAPISLMCSDELASLIDIPRRERLGLRVHHIEHFGLSGTSSMDAQSTTVATISLGQPVDGTQILYAAHPLVLPVSRLASHMFVCGTTGAGKSFGVKHILRQLSSMGVPMLIIEPVKQEYRALQRELNADLDALGEPGCSLELNPFRFEGVPLATHIDHLKALFCAAYPMPNPGPYVLEASLIRVYEQAGWRVDAGAQGSAARWPQLADLLEVVRSVIRESEYSDRVRQELAGILLTRIGNLCVGGKKRLLDVNGSASFETLLRTPRIIEMQNIGDPEQRAFLMGLILIKLYEGCLGKGPANQLRSIVVIEEAHRLLEEPRGALSSESAGAQHKAIGVFVDMLAEMRSYGTGFIIAEQSPSRISRQVIKNTGTKLVHQLLDEEDWALMGASMGITHEQARALVSLPRGHALWFSQNLQRPVRVAVAQQRVTR